MMCPKCKHIWEENWDMGYDYTNCPKCGHELDLWDLHGDGLI